MLKPSSSVPYLDKTIKNVSYGEIHKMKEKIKALQSRIKQLTDERFLIRKRL